MYLSNNPRRSLACIRALRAGLLSGRVRAGLLWSLSIQLEMSMVRRCETDGHDSASHPTGQHVPSEQRKGPVAPMGSGVHLWQSLVPLLGEIPSPGLGGLDKRIVILFPLSERSIPCVVREDWDMVTLHRGVRVYVRSIFFFFTWRQACAIFVGQIAPALWIQFLFAALRIL